MDTAWFLMLLAFTWSGVGVIVALLLGRILRNMSPVLEETRESGA